MTEGNPTAQMSTRSQFYADDGLLSGEDPHETQRALDLFTNIFARVGLKMNATKTKVMSMKGCKTHTTICQKAYIRRMTGTGLSNRERCLEKVDCELCGATINRQYVKNHQRTLKCIRGRNDWTARNSTSERLENPDQPQGVGTEIEPPIEYRFCMPLRQTVPCPVPDCPYATSTRTEMRRHFRGRHPDNCIIITEEGKLPQCENCGLFQRNVDLKHQRSEDCKRATKSRKARSDEKRHQLEREITFTVLGTPIERVKEFKYLGRILDEGDDDWLALQSNLKKAREKWSRIGRILSSEKADPRTMATFYKAIIQAVLLFGAESWVLSNRMMKPLRSFHRRCARHITGRNIRLNAETNEWTYPDSETTLREAGFWPIEEYINRRKDTILGYARERPIYDKCIQSTPVALSSRKKVWWELDSINYLADDA
jgi:hypothetical protein